jgi:hypothetical protein
MVAFTFTLLGWRIGGYSGGGRMGSGSPVVKGYSSGLFFRCASDEWSLWEGETHWPCEPSRFRYGSKRSE